jgi:hypothetical protein
MIIVEGQFGTKAKILADSISPAGIRFTTFQIEYPRIILAELNTHRMLAKNSASSRAIPFKKMVEQLTGRPVRFGAANKGMADAGPHDALINGYTAEQWWDLAKLSATRFSDEFHEAGFAKQIYNRLTEPFQMMRTVLSGTEFDNFFWLRNHEAADPTLHELARVMWEARQQSVPVLLQPGEWHLPYVPTLVSSDGSGAFYYLNDDDVGTTGHIPLEQARKVSSARCAAVSFRNIDYGLEKCIEVYDRLVGDDRKHASAFEHQATPAKHNKCIVGQPDAWEEGISHMDRDYQLWSGPLRGWVQYRKLIPGENHTGKT